MKGVRAHDRLGADVVWRLDFSLSVIQDKEKRGTPTVLGLVKRCLDGEDSLSVVWRKQREDREGSLDDA